MGTFDKYLQLADKTYFNRLGKVTKIVGLTIESVGPNAKLNDLCRIIIDREQNISTMAEVVGFRDKHLLLMPFESVEGIGVGCIVENTGHPLTVKSWRRTVRSYIRWNRTANRCGRIITSV